MPKTKTSYHLPKGHSLIEILSLLVLKPNHFLSDPIGFVSNNMKRFEGTYGVPFGIRERGIATQDPDFIDYVLKGNHKNYHKSEFLSKQLALFIGHGLLTSNGAYWLRQRRLIQPGFHHSKIVGLYSIMADVINDFLEKFPTGKAIDIYPLVHQLTFKIVLKSLFNIQIPESLIDELSQTITELQDFVIKDANQPYRRVLYPFTQERKKSLKKSVAIQEIVRTIIRERKEHNDQHDDLLAMLLNATYEDNGEHMSEKQLIEEILILIIAGHETTANALSWLLYLIASHQDIQSKLQASFSNMQLFDSAKDTYVNAVINEGMRLYPPAWVVDRVALEDDSFKEYIFPKGTRIVLFLYGLHHNESYWKNASAFNPDRFISDDNQLIKAKNFYPFGAGPRMCIGNHFAMAEMSFFLHAFLNRFEIKPTATIPKKKPLITLRPDKVILDVVKK